MITTKDGKGWTPLLWASFHGHAEVAEALLANGNAAKYVAWLAELAASDADDADDAKMPQGASPAVPVNSPLHWAAFKGHSELVWLLVSAGLSVSDVDSCGNTALHLASSAGHTDIVKTLLTCGVDLSLYNWYGNTALALATNTTIRQLLAALVEQGRCAATNVAFGPDEPLYMCSNCLRGFTEEASTASVVKGAVGRPFMRPVRHCSECMYKIQEAESVLEQALHGGASAASDSKTSGDSAAAATAPAPAADGVAGAGAGAGAGASAADGADGDAAGSGTGTGAGVDDHMPPLERIQAALTAAQDVSGNVDLVARAQAEIARLTAARELAAAVAAVEARRPLVRRADAAPLQEALAAAKRAGVDYAEIAPAQTTLEVTLAEVRLTGAATVCKNIAMATHAHDGDLSHLRQALDTLLRHGYQTDVISSAQALLKRLDAEVQLSDGNDTVAAAVTDVERRSVKHAGEDPTTLDFMPAIDGEEPKRLPTKIQKALDRLSDAIEALLALAESAEGVRSFKPWLLGWRWCLPGADVVVPVPLCRWVPQSH